MGGCMSTSRSVAEEEKKRRIEYRNNHISGIHTTVTNYVSHQPQACYGEYNCPFCGRYWTSTLVLFNTYQICRRCNRRVYPKNLRAVRQSDFKFGENRTLNSHRPRGNGPCQRKMLF